MRWWYTYLIIPSNNSHLISEELAHVSEWAGEHNLRLNMEKYVEVIMHQPQKRLKIPAAYL